MKSRDIFFLDSGFVVNRAHPCLLMYKTVICVVYVNDYLFWEHSQYDIDNVMKYFNRDDTSYKGDIQCMSS